MLYRIARTAYRITMPYRLRVYLWTLRHHAHTVMPPDMPVISDVATDDSIAYLRSLGNDDRARAVSRLVEPFVLDGTWRSHFELWEQAGFHITPNHFYQPIPDTRDLRPELWQKDSDLPGVNMNLSGQVEFATMCSRFATEYGAFAERRTSDPAEFYLDNTSLTGLDAAVLHCMVRYHQPRRIVEAGSGMSSLVIAHAARLNDNTPEYTVIDPYPNETLRQGLPGVSRLLTQPVEQVDRKHFTTLMDGDILFIDTSHVIKTCGDVTALLLDIVPRLQPGVIVHVHDIFFPQEYPRAWLAELRYYWTEQYLLQAFLCCNAQFTVLFASNYICHTRPETVAAFPRFPHGEVGGGSMWLRRAAPRA